MRTAPRWVTAALTTVALLAPFLPSSPATGSTGRRVTVTTVARGIVHKRIVAPAWPNRINVLEIDPRTAATIDVGLATGSLGGRAPTSVIADRHSAIAAINGSFVQPWGRPSGMFAQDGRLFTSPLYDEFLFAPSADESSYQFGRFPLKMSAFNPSASFLPLRISKWNDGDVRRGQVGAYTPASAGYIRVPRSSCSVRLSPPTSTRWGTGGVGVVKVHKVEARRCAWKPLSAARKLVLAAERGTAAGTTLRSYSAGDQVTVTWSVGLPHVFDAVGGFPRLIADGRVVATRCAAYVCLRHPRTGVGLTADGKILFITVDGRQPRYSIGMNVLDFAYEFKRHGAVQALNLDGGGSTTMVIRGRVVNRPSDGRQRRVNHALLVLKGKDQSEPYIPWTAAP